MTYSKKLTAKKSVENAILAGIAGVLAFAATLKPEPVVVLFVLMFAFSALNDFRRHRKN